jgi:hypothetical protein
LLSGLIQYCWMKDPNQRPDAKQVVAIVNSLKATPAAQVTGYRGNFYSEEHQTPTPGSKQR